jgi:hypothetical protein
MPDDPDVLEIFGFQNMPRVTILMFYPCRTGCLRRLVCEVVRARVILVLYRSIDVTSKSKVQSKILLLSMKLSTKLLSSVAEVPVHIVLLSIQVRGSYSDPC